SGPAHSTTAISTKMMLLPIFLLTATLVYAIGYTYNGEGFKNDIILYTCDLDGGNKYTDRQQEVFKRNSDSIHLYTDK
ncbi:MAG: hypothetical protein IPL67_19815, partial [Ignavibacteria bacterium]|nr:hypothetical protein [Ignavibacteria bacterium]